MIAKTKTGTLDDILATRVKTVWPYRINFGPEPVNYDRWSAMKQWCEDHCEGRWNVEQTHALYFQFDSERDAIKFSLRWS